MIFGVGGVLTTTSTTSGPFKSYLVAVANCPYMQLAVDKGLRYRY